jgi:hypothetical protein
MKLITYQEFCRMPAGTIFAPYEPCVLDDRLSIKVDGGDENGWFNGVMPLEPWNVEEIWEKGECPVSFETYDGANADYIDYDLILVFDEADVDRMIDILKWAKKGCVGEPENCPEGCTDEKRGEWVVCGGGMVSFIRRDEI